MRYLPDFNIVLLYSCQLQRLKHFVKPMISQECFKALLKAKLSSYFFLKVIKINTRLSQFSSFVTKSDNQNSFFNLHFGLVKGHVAKKLEYKLILFVIVFLSAGNAQMS